MQVRILSATGQQETDMTIRNETVLGAVLAILASTLGFAFTLM